MSSDILRIRGKLLTKTDVERLKVLIMESPQAGRRELSQKISAAFGWRQPNGNLQDMACREILRRMEQKGLVVLPPGRAGGGGHRKKLTAAPLELFAEESPPGVSGVFGSFSAMTLMAMTMPEEVRRWKGLIERYHYLGWSPAVGRSIKYWIRLDGQEVGLIGFASPCWKLACRDTYIGWDAPTRERNLQGIANNHRFLILPWVRVKYLASHVLSVAARRVAEDWWKGYGVRLSLLETFVDPERYRGTCYKAANWQYLGQSRGSSKSGNGYVYHGRVKDVYGYPLSPDFRARLQGIVS